ncbi:MAG: VWA domain-containing protein [Candidatus Bathyarchaeota archaeon]
MQRSSRRIHCSDLSDDRIEILQEIANMQMGRGLDYDSRIMDRARKKAVERFQRTQERREEAEAQLEGLEAEQMRKGVEMLLASEEDPEEILESILTDQGRLQLEAEVEELSRESQGLTERDFNEALSEFGRKGYTNARKLGLTLTSRGAQLLGKGLLNRILQRLARLGVGPHKIEDVGHGPWFASTIRPYESGDPYERISIERSLLATLERGDHFGDLRLEDFRVYEAIHSTEVTFGILVDQSASMNRGGKLQAAVETALSLVELTRSHYPEDKLRVFAFSEEAREIVPWELPELVVPMGYTDISDALRAFREAVIHEAGNKQVYLITDSAPNFENMVYVGFERALAGVIEEAKRYRAAGIILNIVMLDDDEKLREMAKAIAKQNLGRVFFTRPGQLGDALVEDYLLSKREFLRF